jgi:hypothetical protein
MQFRNLIGPAIVRSVSKPSPVPRMVTVPWSSMAGARPREVTAALLARAEEVIEWMLIACGA